MRSRREVSGGVWSIERRIARKASRQIGVGDKELAKGYSVRFAILDNLISQRLIVLFVCNVDSAELFLELRTQSVRSEVLARAQKGKPASAELTRHVAKSG